MINNFFPSKDNKLLKAIFGSNREKLELNYTRLKSVYTKQSTDWDSNEYLRQISDDI